MACRRGVLERSFSVTSLPVPAAASSSRCVAARMSGWRTSSASIHSSVLEEVSVPALNKSCEMDVRGANIYFRLIKRLFN
ncbi:unnamed protein product [Spirodela intermedia]|uniref:Uncharacterized protein n=1 Tax=Spirodela intermedia TaxID=51605 RepID=A0A7I8JX28_SPIIN|nr:unnamed protein product [Spirodela intermedia]